MPSMVSIGTVFLDLEHLMDALIYQLLIQSGYLTGHK